MASPTYKQDGQFYNRPAGTAITAGTVELISAAHGAGVADNDIAENEVGALHIAGVYDCPNPDDTAFAVGAEVEWDATNEKVVVATAGDFDLGVAFYAYVAGSMKLAVLINGRTA